MTILLFETAADGRMPNFLAVNMLKKTVPKISVQYICIIFIGTVPNFLPIKMLTKKQCQKYLCNTFVTFSYWNSAKFAVQ